jgi:hypothetical protein
MATVARIVATGRAIMQERMLGSGTEPKIIGWGLSDAGLADGNEDLANETESGDRVTGTSSRVTTTTTNDTYRVVGTRTSSSTQEIKEVGLFNTAGTMFIRGTFTGINVDDGDSIQFTVEGQLIAPAP